MNIVTNGIAVSCILYHMYNVIHMTQLMGTLYPAISTMRVIQQGDPREMPKWLAYWTLFVIFMLIEPIFDMCLFWIPAYTLLKTIVVISLYYPSPNESTLHIVHLLWFHFMSQCDYLETLLSGFIWR